MSLREVRLEDALDLPPEVQDVQSAYWQAQRDWIELRDAYRLVIEDMVGLHKQAANGEDAQATEGKVS